MRKSGGDMRPECVMQQACQSQFSAISSVLRGLFQGEFAYFLGRLCLFFRQVASKSRCVLVVFCACSRLFTLCLPNVRAGTPHGPCLFSPCPLLHCTMYAACANTRPGYVPDMFSLDSSFVHTRAVHGLSSLCSHCVRLRRDIAWPYHEQRANR